MRRGGYVLFESGTPALILIATGSEVQIAMAVARKLADEGQGVRVVSMPCAEVFMAQDAAYRESVLPAAQRKRLAVEAGVSVYWRAFVGLDGDVVGVDRFGESAPAAAVLDYLGLTADAVYTRAKALLA